MVDIYEVVINDPVYLTIAVLLAISVVFSIIRKLFKFVVIIIACIVIYIGYLHCLGLEVPQTMDELIDEQDLPIIDTIRISSVSRLNLETAIIKKKKSFSTRMLASPFKIKSKKLYY